MLVVARIYSKLSRILMGMLDSHPLTMRITIEKSSVNNMHETITFLGTNFQNNNDTLTLLMYTSFVPL